MNSSRRKAYFQVQAEIVISAPAALVWAVLVDLARYSDWNSFVYSMKSNLRVGDRLTMKVRMRPRWGWNVVTVNEIVLIETQRRLIWRTLSPWWLLQGQRFQTLEPLDGNRTRYTTSEGFSGILAPLVKWVVGKDLQRGFENVARDLKQRAETLASS